MFTSFKTRIGWLVALGAALGGPGALTEPATAQVIGVGISNINISISPGPKIPCGGVATVTVTFDYSVPAYGAPLPQSGVVQIWEDDWWPQADDLIASAGFTITLADGQSGTKSVNIPIGCEPKNADFNCELVGNDGTDDEYGSHTLYPSVAGVHGPNLTVWCSNDSGEVTIGDNPINPDGDALVTAALETTEGLAHVDWRLSYDPTHLMVIDAQLDPGSQAMFETSNVDFTTPGLIDIQAHNPTNVPPAPVLVMMQFTAFPSAPYESFALDTTSDSVFSDEFFLPLGINHGQGFVSVVPADTTPPVIDVELLDLNISAGTISGAPGAVTDDFIGTDYVRLELMLQPPELLISEEPTTLTPGDVYDRFDIAFIAGRDAFQLRATDALGNSSTEEITYGWSESFDLYVPDSDLHGQEGWKGWDDDPAFSAPVTGEQARSEDQSVRIEGDADLVREVTGEDSGLWSFAAWQYIPSDFASAGTGPFDGTYFILFNTYQDGVHNNSDWSVQMQFDSNDGLCKVFHGDGLNTIDVPYATDRWVKIQSIIDLEEDWTRIYYDDELVTEYTWTGGVLGGGGGALDIAAVDLVANGSSSVYYDDLKLEPITGCGDPDGDADGDTLTRIEELILGTSSCRADTDEDGVNDDVDNCPLEPNPDQQDSNKDGIGDACQQAQPCPADVNGDGTVNVDDLVDVILAWGDCEGDCPEDVNGDNTVDVDDLVEIILEWGDC